MGESIALYRKKFGLSLSEASKSAGIPTDIYRRMEQGDTSVPIAAWLAVSHRRGRLNQWVKLYEPESLFDIVSDDFFEKAKRS